MTLERWNEVPDFAERDLVAIEQRTQELGHYLFEHLDEQRPNVLQRRWWDERLMEWAMRDEGLKVQLFRFVDVLPMLHTNEAVVGHLNEYLNEVRTHLPTAVRTALGIGRRSSFTRAAIARLARLSAMDLARRFIAGTNVNEVVEAAQRERREGRGFTLDILGEAVTSDTEAERFFNAYVSLIASVAPEVNRWPLETKIDRSVLGVVPRMNLSIKLSALDSRFNAIDPEGALSRAGERLRDLLRVAKSHNSFINVDMESYEKKDLTLRIFKEVLQEEEFRDIGDVGIVIQCYLRDAAKDLQDLVAWAKRRGRPVWVRLVKGAYWDYETVHAQADGWPVPVYQQKWQSDASFERATRFVMENHQHLRPALGTHNIRSIAHGLATAEHLGIAKNAFEIQIYGELIPGMAYLVRRLLENTSNDSFLRAGFIEQVARDELLRDPLGIRHDGSFEKEEEVMVGSATTAVHRRQRFDATFQNHPPVDFAQEANRAAMREALRQVMTRFGCAYPLVIGDRNVATEATLDSIDPSFRDRIVGSVSLASKMHVDEAVTAAKEALAAWRNEPVESRAEIIRRAAQLMRDQFFELAALEVYECGKGWGEATNDVCEAIDFCEYYAKCAIAIAQPD
ncbi:MAG: bifunctional proline dehydrogenase/L-glutamate gamma-semialdehyde dehydrogenase, partial [Planctomycetia bacterium]|nr:bifunctional proline dehydrogenase/L-glutamate gamma-semialdehyde dehydrogenase [Planctomycetia bacterium]